MGTGTKIVLVLCLMIFCGSGYYLADYCIKAYRAQTAFSELKEAAPPAKAGQGRDLSALLEENPDLVGWITIDGTKIDYPVMQTKGEDRDPEYYLHRDFHRQPSDAGTPFMDAFSDIYLPTSNWLIYGHHMRSGIMFHDLIKYEKKDFWKKHPEFRFDTITAPGTYQIIAACSSKIYDENDDAFKYYEYAGITSEEDFDRYIQGVKSLSIYDTGETAHYGDQLVTLSTCAYHTDNGRFFIVGKRIRD